MSDNFQTEPSGTPPRPATPPPVSAGRRELPSWLARRLLRRGERITWVSGPRRSPAWEQYVTHPALFLVALGLAAVCVAGAVVDPRYTSPLLPTAVCFGGAVVLASVFVLAISVTYFTRLVVTNYRLVILQGYEVAKSWKIDDLPASLIRYRWRGSEGEGRAIDLDALQTLLGGSSDKFTDSKTIVAFGKQLDQITSREKRQP